MTPPAKALNPDILSNLVGRILVIDDNPDVREDFIKVLSVQPNGSAGLAQMESMLFGTGDAGGNASPKVPIFEVDVAADGKLGCELAERASKEGRPHAVAFVDMRMPGWNGLKTIEALWKVDRHLQIVICTAYSDHGWHDIVERLGVSDQLLVLYKPFHPIEVQQLACSLSVKWALLREREERLDDLEQRVKERTRDLTAANEKLDANLTRLRETQDQLIQAAKLAAVGQLAGGIAHDFNNLLTVILGCCDMLSQSQDQLEAGFYLREVELAAQRAAGMTEQLLMFSRKQILQPQIMSLNDVVASADLLLNHLLGKEIDRNLQLAPGLGPIEADAKQLQQVLVNLALNARDAMPDGGALAITTASVELDEPKAAEHPDRRPGSYVLLTVSDTGCGMDAATRGKIFDPFFTTKDQSQGKGLGLSMTYGLVKQTGGWIEVESEPGVGATFRIYLPLSTSDSTAPVAELSTEPELRGLETILVVEDDDQIRELVVLTLTGYGYKVVQARQGDEALQVADTLAPIHLLVTDVVMPGISGVEVAEVIAEKQPNIGVLLMSGYASEVIADLGDLPHKADFLPKPFKPQTLVQRVREVLDTSGGMMSA